MTLSTLRLPVLLATLLAGGACYGGDALSLAGSDLANGNLSGGGRSYKSGCDKGPAASRASDAARPAVEPPPAASSSASDFDDILLFPVVFGGPGLSDYDIDCDPDAGPYGTCQ